MRMRLIAWILMTCFFGMQASAATMAAARQAAMAETVALPQSAAPAPAMAGTIDVPVGTKIPLNLVTQIMSKSTKPGATVRAVVAFPVTVGNQLAIPAGTYVEGQLISAAANSGAKGRYGAKKTGSGPGLQIHFTKLVYANGYTVPLDAQNGEASVTGAATGGPEVASADDGVPRMPIASREDGPDGGAAFLEGQFGEPFPPQLPAQPSRPGPNPAIVIGGALGGLAVVGLISLLVAKRHVKSVDAVLYDAGWQFSMTLTNALALDKAQVMDAAKMAPAS